MSRLISVRAGRGRMNHALSLTDGRGSIDAATPVLGGDFSTWTPGDVQPVGSTDGGVRNVGHRIALTTYVGNIVVAAGQTVSGLDIYGKVTFTGTGTLIDCRVRGPVWGQGPTWAAGTPTNDACINSTYNGRGSTIRYCTVDMTGRENVWTDGIRGNNFTMEYCEIMRVVDGFGGVAGSYYGPTLIQNSRIHNGYYIAWRDSSTGLGYPNYTSQSDLRLHGDGMQIQAFSNYTIRGNYIGGARAALGPNGSTVKQAHRDYLLPADQPYIAAVDAAEDYANSGLIIQNSVLSGGPVGVLLEKNWLAGGDATVNLFASVNDTLGGVTVQNNRFIRQSTLPGSDGYEGRTIHKATVCTSTITGNVWDNDGTAVPVTTY